MLTDGRTDGRDLPCKCPLHSVGVKNAQQVHYQWLMWFIKPSWLSLTGPMISPLYVLGVLQEKMMSFVETATMF
jgi:hypothetical protein